MRVCVWRVTNVMPLLLYDIIRQYVAMKVTQVLEQYMKLGNTNGLDQSVLVYHVHMHEEAPHPDRCRCRTVRVVD